MINNQVSDTNSYTPYQKSFGKTCVVPGVLLKSNDVSDNEDIEKDVKVFCELMNYHRRSARTLNTTKSYVEQDLWQTNYVWVRKEGHRPALSSVYDGPYQVISRNKKYFIILGWEGERKVSVDRLKTAYVGDQSDDSEESGVVNDQTEESEEGIAAEDESTSTPGIVRDETGVRRSLRNTRKPDRWNY